jgi:hypothetical protein
MIKVMYVVKFPVLFNVVAPAKEFICMKKIFQKIP